MAYLAQHELFDQIPQLSRDIVEPDYCVLSDAKKELSSVGIGGCVGGCVGRGDGIGVGEEELIPLVQRNSWFGPAGTVSPLHHDRNHNLFCQVFGSKSILLIDPSHSSMLYPNDGIHSNTSRVDFQKEGWHERWPNVVGVPCMLVTVLPGEMLYIPPKWWHFCVAEETSFSVSYWW
jgi:lysine-specific demethylase 8